MMEGIINEETPEIKFLKDFRRENTGNESDVTLFSTSPLENCSLKPSDVERQVLDWALSYLEQKKCPSSLALSLARTVSQELGKSMEQLEGHTNGNTYFSAEQLHADTISQLHKLCETSPLEDLVEEADPAAAACAIKNKRRNMEDRHVLLHDLNSVCNLPANAPRHRYYAVFDGHAGIDAASFAAAHLHQNIASHPDFLTDPEKAIREGFRTTDEQLLERCKRTVPPMKSGCTALCALVRGEGELFLAWLGDSQALLVQGGVPTPLMSPHKPDREDEKQRIEDAGGMVVFYGTWRVNGILAVSRAFGDPEYKPAVSSEPDVARVELGPQDEVLVLACDGLWDRMTQQDVVTALCDQLTEGPPTAKACAERLVHTARERGSTDNITAIVVFLRDPGLVAESLSAAAASRQQLHNGSSNGTSALPFSMDIAAEISPYGDMPTPPIGDLISPLQFDNQTFAETDGKKEDSQDLKEFSSEEALMAEHAVTEASSTEEMVTKLASEIVHETIELAVSQVKREEEEQLLQSEVPAEENLIQPEEEENVANYYNFAETEYPTMVPNSSNPFDDAPAASSNPFSESQESSQVLLLAGGDENKEDQEGFPGGLSALELRENEINSRISLADRHIMEGNQHNPGSPPAQKPGNPFAISEGHLEQVDLTEPVVPSEPPEEVPPALLLPLEIPETCPPNDQSTSYTPFEESTSAESMPSEIAEYPDRLETVAGGKSPDPDATPLVSSPVVAAISKPSAGVPDESLLLPEEAVSSGQSLESEPPHSPQVETVLTEVPPTHPESDIQASQQEIHNSEEEKEVSSLELKSGQEDFGLLKTSVENTPSLQETVENLVMKDPEESTPVTQETLENDLLLHDRVENVAAFKEPVENAPVLQEEVESTPMTHEPVETAPISEEPVENAPVNRESIENTLISLLENDSFSQEPLKNAATLPETIENVSLVPEEIAVQEDSRLDALPVSSPTLELADELRPKTLELAAALTGTDTEQPHVPVVIPEGMPEAEGVTEDSDSEKDGGWSYIKGDSMEMVPSDLTEPKEVKKTEDKKPPSTKSANDTKTVKKAPVKDQQAAKSKPLLESKAPADKAKGAAPKNHTTLKPKPSAAAAPPAKKPATLARPPMSSRPTAAPSTKTAARPSAASATKKPEAPKPSGPSRPPLSTKTFPSTRPALSKASAPSRPTSTMRPAATKPAVASKVGPTEASKPPAKPAATSKLLAKPPATLSRPTATARPPAALRQPLLSKAKPTTATLAAKPSSAANSKPLGTSATATRPKPSAPRPPLRAAPPSKATSPKVVDTTKPATATSRTPKESTAPKAGPKAPAPRPGARPPASKLHQAKPPTKRPGAPPQQPNKSEPKAVPKRPPKVETPNPNIPAEKAPEETSLLQAPDMTVPPAESLVKGAGDPLSGSPPPPPSQLPEEHPSPSAIPPSSSDREDAIMVEI